MTEKEFAILKLSEEMSELSELLIKMITKPDGRNTPERIERLIEETGDVQLRLNIFVKEMNIFDEVKRRIAEKLKERKYKSV